VTNLMLDSEFILTPVSSCGGNGCRAKYPARPWERYENALSDLSEGAEQEVIALAGRG